MENRRPVPLRQKEYFLNNDFRIIVTFDNGVSGIETYEKSNWAPLSDAEIKKSPRGEWWRHEMAEKSIRNGLELRYNQETRFAEYNAISNTLTIADYAALSRVNARNAASPKMIEF